MRVGWHAVHLHGLEAMPALRRYDKATARTNKARGKAMSEKPGEYCFWCNPESMPQSKYEGPHATWCPHFREEQRAEISKKLNPEATESTSTVP